MLNNLLKHRYYSDFKIKNTLFGWKDYIKRPSLLLSGFPMISS